MSEAVSEPESPGLRPHSSVVSIRLPGVRLASAIAAFFCRSRHCRCCCGGIDNMSAGRADRPKELSLLLLLLALVPLVVESQSESVTEASGTLMPVAEDLRLGWEGTPFSR